MTGLLIWIAATLATGIFALYRNHCVYRYLLNVAVRVHVAGECDIDNHRPYEWRWEAFKQVTYDEMFFKFWKPLDSFYPDKSFMEITE